MNKTGYVSLLLLLLAAACGKSAGQPQSADVAGTETDKPSTPKAVSEQPVTLTVAIPAANFSEEEFNKLLAEPVRKKYPYITLKFVDTSAKGQTIQELVASKQIPDFYGGQQANFAPLVDLDIKNDINGLIKSNGFDLSVIQPELLDGIKEQIGLAYLPGLPIFQSTWALAYNKSLFDRFGVPYPKDGMTWDQIADIAQIMSRTEQGVSYWGISMDRTYSDTYKQISLPFADFTKNVSTFQAPGWKQQFEFALNLFRKNGSPPLLSGTDWDKAWNEGRVAMRTASTSTFQRLLGSKDMVWDVVSYPQSPLAPGIGMEMNAHWWMITRQSPNQDAAFKALSVALSSEVQTALSRGLRLPVVKDTSIQSQAGADVAGTQGRNVVAYTKLKNPKPILYGTIVSQFVKIQADQVNAMFYQGKDTNTALREADELMNKAIQESLRNKP
ncbi:ABC transporter substrate-binding protein [Paenibacillus ginsengarvi]|uniref:Extracellular solute-binding protein n=1 Tax=Paenibacillus ginsengarvi TaxID=400777 RepID=A0A3B0BQ81_9BACL|nr:extracellular solute-binding protein [Paenibacillus ginsengarvi]RKN74960.1 extracellular solute-binding protein [Paenibacillus ginsengarvi]